MISLPTKHPTPHHIGDVVKSHIISDWLDSVFSNDEKMAKSTTSSAQFLCSSLSPDTKIIRPWISFRVKTNKIENQYDIYSRTFADGSSIIGGFEFNVSYAPITGIYSLFIITAIAYT